MLGNFGGNTGWYGAIPDIHEGFTHALNYKNTTIAGTAIVPEGIFQNEIVYDYTLQLQYDGKIQPDDIWLESWVRARYGPISGDQLETITVPGAYMLRAYTLRFPITLRFFPRFCTAPLCYDFFLRFSGTVSIQIFKIFNFF